LFISLCYQVEKKRDVPPKKKKKVNDFVAVPHEEKKLFVDEIQQKQILKRVTAERARNPKKSSQSANRLCSSAEAQLLS
tara:strand:+ start:285 stop:521 length:237 start_codon:yes stop_codon:yes gene_type:complete